MRLSQGLRQLPYSMCSELHYVSVSGVPYFFPFSWNLREIPSLPQGQSGEPSKKTTCKDQRCLHRRNTALHGPWGMKEVSSSSPDSASRHKSGSSSRGPWGSPGSFRAERGDTAPERRVGLYTRGGTVRRKGLSATEEPEQGRGPSTHTPSQVGDTENLASPAVPHTQHQKKEQLEGEGRGTLEPGHSPSSTLAARSLPLARLQGTGEVVTPEMKNVLKIEPGRKAMALSKVPAGSLPRRKESLHFRTVEASE